MTTTSRNQATVLTAADMCQTYAVPIAHVVAKVRAGEIKASGWKDQMPLIEATEARRWINSLPDIEIERQRLKRPAAA